MICCIDANIFIWGIKKQCAAGQEINIEKAAYLFELMDKKNDKIMIPAVVLAEILAPEPLEKHPIIMDAISKNIMLVDFDKRCASQYAFLFTNKIEELKKTAKDNNIDNQKMKLDHLIIASAIVGGAKCIYSEDKGIKTFGQKHIEVRKLPDLPTSQKDLFGNLIR